MPESSSVGTLYYPTAIRKSLLTRPVTNEPVLRNHRVMADTPDGPQSGFPTVLTAALAFVVAGLAAIGLTGDALLRAVRNSPRWIAVWFTLALIGAGIFVLGQLWPRKTTANENAAKTTRFTVAWVLGIIGLALFVGATSAAIWFGAYAVHDRELPLVTLQAAPVAAAPSAASGRWTEGTIEVTITARAVGMTTKNDLLVQVVGLFSDPGPRAPSRSGTAVATASPTPGLAMPSAVVVQICESNHTWPQSAKNLDPAKAKLLMWDRIGPKADGTIDATWKIQVQQADTRMCAPGLLSEVPRTATPVALHTCG
jgi:hypothetical protein